MFKMHPAKALSILVVVVLLNGRASLHAETLDEIVESLSQHESSYDDIDVKLTTKYRRTNPTSDGNFVISKDLETHFVSQGERFRMDRTGTSASADHVASADRIRMFDGQISRVLEQTFIVNITKGRVEDQHFVRPHLMPVRHADIAVPLSVYLRGEDAVRQHPNGRLDASLGLKVEYLGEEICNDLACHKILVDVYFKKSGQPHDGRVFWLAKERNFLPVMQEAYTYRFSTAVPVGIYEVTKLAEIHDDVWFPMESLYTAYEKFAIQRESQQTPQWTYQYSISSVDLSPEYDSEYFSKLEIPKAAIVYDETKPKK